MTKSHSQSPGSFFKVDALGVEVYPSQAAMALSAARTAATHLEATLASQNAAAVILASATSQIQFLDELTAAKNVDWSRITVFHMDEYLGITADHRASFHRFLKERVESRIRPKAIHYICGEALEPLLECERYTRLLRAQAIDLCCLGIGENGHVAFNDPPVANFQDPYTVKLVQLDLPCRQQQVGEGYYPSVDAVPQYAFSLTVPALCNARKMVCVVPEKRKATAVRDTLRGPVSTACPASYLRTQSQATLFLDADSASLL